jgi:hypothetical protein
MLVLVLVLLLELSLRMWARLPASSSATAAASSPPAGREEVPAVVDELPLDVLELLPQRRVAAQAQEAQGGVGQEAEEQGPPTVRHKAVPRQAEVCQAAVRVQQSPARLGHFQVVQAIAR